MTRIPGLSITLPTACLKDTTVHLPLLERFQKHCPYLSTGSEFSCSREGKLISVVLTFSQAGLNLFFHPASQPCQKCVYSNENQARITSQHSLSILTFINCQPFTNSRLTIAVRSGNYFAYEFLFNYF